MSPWLSGLFFVVLLMGCPSCCLGVSFVKYCAGWSVLGWGMMWALRLIIQSTWHWLTIFLFVFLLAGEAILLSRVFCWRVLCEGWGVQPWRIMWHLRLVVHIMLRWLSGYFFAMVLNLLSYRRPIIPTLRDFLYLEYVVVKPAPRIVGCGLILLVMLISIQNGVLCGGDDVASSPYSPNHTVVLSISRFHRALHVIVSVWYFLLSQACLLPLVLYHWLP